MLAKWNRPVFSFRFYEGKISCVSFIRAVRDAPSLPLLHSVAPSRAAAINDRPICVILSLRHCARAARRPKMCSRLPQSLGFSLRCVWANERGDRLGFGNELTQ